MSFFHKVKKAVVGTKQEAGTASLCPEYDSVRGDFEQLHDVMIRVRQHLLTYRESNSRMWTSATSLSNEFANTLDIASGDDHPYATMAGTMKTSHAALPAEREKLDTMLNACLFPLKEQLAQYEQLKVRMAAHDKQKDEVVYYQGKVNGLRSARESSKKSESASDKEKYERNIRKMAEQETEFHAMDMQLTAELRYAYEHRVAVLGPIMLAFVLAEKEIANRYTQAIHDVRLVDVNDANAWLAKHEAAMAAKSGSPRNASVVTTSTTQRSTAPLVVIPDILSGDSLASVSTTGVVISEPQYGTGPNGAHLQRGDSFTKAAVSDPFAAAQVQSPRSPSGVRTSGFDNFEASFDDAPAHADPFYNVGTNAAAAAAATTTSSTSATNTAPIATTATDASLSTADTDGVPYTIGSASTLSAPSTSSSTITTESVTVSPPVFTAAPVTSLVAPTTASTAPLVNGTSSDFPVESVSAATSASSTVVGDIAAPAVVMDDMALEQTRGAEQLDAAHGDSSSAAASDMADGVAAEPYAGAGVGEKTSLAPSTTTTTTTESSSDV